MTTCKSPAQKAVRFSSARGSEGHSERIIIYGSEKPEHTGAAAELQAVGGGGWRSDPKT